MSKKLVYGVGINDADYVVVINEELGYVDGKRKRKEVWRCPFYMTWVNMLVRGYSEKLKLKYHTYKDCTVCEDWLRFSNFKSWMEAQDWEGKQLDKDILFIGNKLYSPTTCAFVSAHVNKFVLDSGSVRGDFKIGVNRRADNGKFMSRCCNPFTGDRELLGHFTDEQAAYEAWLDKKLQHAKALAALQTDERVAKALIARYENYGECNV